MSLPPIIRKNSEFLLVVIAGLALGWFTTPGLHHLTPRFSLDERSLSYGPDRVWTVECLAKGWGPWWNPYVHCGTAHFAAMHVGVLYPPNWFLYALPYPWALNLDHLLHRALAFIGAWLLARLLGLRRAGSWLGALIYTTGAYLLFHQVHVPMFQTACWLPFVIAAAIRARDDSRWAAGAAALLALVFFAGYPQLFLYTLAVYVLFAVHVWPLRHLGRLGLTLALVILLTAAQWIPTRDFVKETVRQKMQYEEFVSYSHSIQTAPIYFFPFLYGTQISSKLFPQKYSGPGSLGELGQNLPIMAWALLPLGLACGRMRDRWRWAALIVISLTVALGTVLGLAPLLYKIPGLNQFKVLPRYALGFALAGAMLAGAGLDVLLAAEPKRRIRLLAALGGAMLAMAAFGWLCWAMPNWPERMVRGIVVPLVLGALAIAALAGAVFAPMEKSFGRMARTGAVLFAAALLLFEARAYHQASIQEWGRGDYLVKPSVQSPLVDTLHSLRLTFPAHQHPGRFLALYREVGDHSQHSLYPAMNILRHVPSVNFYGPFLPQRIKGYVGMLNTGVVWDPIQPMDFRWFERAGAKYVVTTSHNPGVLAGMDAQLAPRPDQFRRVEGADSATLYQTIHAKQWASWATRIESYTDKDAAGRNVWNPGDLNVWVNKRGGETPSTTPGAKADIKQNLRSPHHFVFDVEAEGHGVLVLRERNSAGWRAWLDGKETRIWEVDLLFMGVAVPAGRHTVELFHTPPRFVNGLGLSGVGALGLGAWLWAIGRMRRRRGENGPTEIAEKVENEDSLKDESNSGLAKTRGDSA